MAAEYFCMKPPEAGNGVRAAAFNTEGAKGCRCSSK
jgi:hypothetical protein